MPWSGPPLPRRWATEQSRLPSRLPARQGPEVVRGCRLGAVHRTRSPAGGDDNPTLVGPPITKAQRSPVFQGWARLRGDLPGAAPITGGECVRRFQLFGDASPVRQVFSPAGAAVGYAAVTPSGAGRGVHRAVRVGAASFGGGATLSEPPEG